MPAALDVHGLDKRFRIGIRGELSVLEGVAFQLAAGQRAALVGPNGSGKSTLLRILAGIEPMDAGRLRVLGGSPRDPAIRARVAYLAESPPFPPELHAEEALHLVAGLYVAGRRRRRERVAEALERVALEQAKARPLGRFSKGMLRRLGLAQVLLQGPDLLLLDEPRSGLDGQGARVLDALLAEARQRGATVLLASHHPALLTTPEDRVLALHDGRLVLDDSVAALVRRTGAVRWSVTGLDDDARTAIEAHIEARGGRIRARGPDEAALTELGDSPDVLGAGR